jgi:hypothetical protein
MQIRLNAAFLRRWEVGFEKFERQSADAATNPLVPIAHVEVNNVGRNLVVPRIGCSCERHVSVSTSRHVARHRSLLTLMAKRSRRRAVGV